MIRAYFPRDKEKILAIFELNVPRYFDPSEVDDFDRYLDQHGQDISHP